MKTIFVSSTFKDMQLERDALQQRALPNINTLAKTYGDFVAFCDLRWGVNTADLSEEEGNKKVLNVCLDVIDRCEPIMIVILGERYGWQPGSQKILEASQRKSMLLEDYEISVTALEIEYGAFHRKAKTLVYCRTIEGEYGLEYGAEDEEHTRKLNLLKGRLASLAQGGLRNYTLKFKDGKVEGVEDFVAMVERDVKTLLSSQWKEYESLTSFGKEMLVNRGIYAEQAQNFAVGNSFKGRIIKAVAGRKNVINIYGSAGSGKTALMGALYCDLVKMGYEVLPVQVGSTTLLSTSGGVLSYLLDYYREICDITSFYDDEAEEEENAFEEDVNDISLKDIYRTLLNREKLDNKIEALADCAEQYEESGKHFVLLVDGVDNFHTDQGELNYCYIPRNIGELRAFTVIFTSNQKLCSLEHMAFEMPVYNNNENLTIIEGMLNKNNRELDRTVLASLVKKCEGKQPLYIKLLLQKLFMMDARDFAVMKNMQAISKRQLEVISGASDDIERLSTEVLREAAERINGELLLPVLEYISLSREGLTEEEIRALLKEKFNKLDFYNFFAYMSDYFILRRNGRYDFANVCAKEGVVGYSKNIKEYARKICNLLLEEFFTIEVKMPKPEYSIVQELIHIALTYGDEDIFVEITSKFIDFDKGLKKSDGGYKYEGAKYALMVFTMCFDEQSERILALMLRLIDSYICADERKKIDILAVLALYNDSTAEGKGPFLQPYYNLMSSIECDNNNLELFANLSFDMFYSAKGSEDSASTKEYLLRYLEAQKAHFEYVLNSDGDVLDILINSIERFNSIVDKKYNDEQLVVTINEHILYYQNYVTLFLTNGVEVLDEDMIDLLGGQLLKLMYMSCQFTESNDSQENAMLAYTILINTYNSTTEGFRECFNESAGKTLGDLYNSAARLYARVGEKSQSQELLKEALNFYEKSYKLKKKEDDTYSERDDLDFMVTIEKIYAQLGEKYEKKRIDIFKNILKLKDNSVYFLGKKMNSAYNLYVILGKEEYALQLAQLCVECLTARWEKYGDANACDIIDYATKSFDMDGFFVCMDDGAYVSRGLGEDVAFAIEVCSSLPKNKKLQALKEQIVELFALFKVEEDEE